MKKVPVEKFLVSGLVTEERVQAPILVGLFTLPFLALILWARVWVPEGPIYFSDGDKVAIFLLAFGGVSSILRLFSSGIGRVIFQGFCAFLSIAGVSAAALSLWSAHVGGFGLWLIPQAVLGLGVASIAWRIRATDQNGWMEANGISKSAGPG